MSLDIRKLLVILTLALAMPTACSKADDHGKEGHEEHGEEGHKEKDGHGEHGEEGHEEHGGEGEAGHEEGVVNLSPEAMAKITLETAPAVMRKISPEIHTTARVAYDDTRLAHVGPRIPGRVGAVDKNLGDFVKKGEALATLDSVVLGKTIAQLRAATVEEALARKTLDRERTLVKEKLSSEQQLIEVEAAHQKALSAKKVAAEQLRLYGGRGVRGSSFRLRAPIDGKIVKKHITLGELVTPENKVFTVADLSNLWIWVDIFERDLSRVHLDDDANIITEAYPNKTFVGKVSYIMDEVDTDTRTVRARIDIANPDGKLKPGMFANVTLLDPHADSAQKVDIVVVPQDAVQRDGDGWIAFVKEGERRFERREVKTGVRTGEFIQILSGVNDGEVVVTKGLFLLKSEAAKESIDAEHDH